MNLKTFILKFKFLYTCALYDNYFEMVKQINLNKSKTKIIYKYKNNKARYQIICFQTILFVYSILLLLGAIWGDSVSVTVHLFFCNWFYFEGIPQVHLIWIVANVVLGIYFIKLLYFHNDGRTFAVLYSLVQPNKNGNKMTFFINANSRFCGQNIRLVEFINQRLLPMGKVYQISINFAWSMLKIKK